MKRPVATLAALFVLPLAAAAQRPAIQTDAVVGGGSSNAGRE